VCVTAVFRVLLGNPWPLWLAGPVLLWIALYSYTKRLTWLCHAWLGVSLAMSPIAAAIAINPGALIEAPALWWIAAFVAFWVAGFDVIYALQDETFDRERGLSSIPAHFGGMKALWISRALHAGSLIFLLAAWTSEPRFGALFGMGIACVAALLAIEHAVMVRSVRTGNLAKGLNMAFFTLNGVVACVLGALGIADVFT
jgi:4-hydroxybenzoate polyprenyltransferase